MPELILSTGTCRWGILGTAFIAQKNWHSIHCSENSELVAVASRNVERAQEFIDNCQSQAPFPDAPRAVGGYDELIAADDIDAIYIPLPTGLRAEWVIKAAEAGKHVLCEKPCGLDVAELQSILDACEKNNVQFMDGVMFMHSNRLDAVRGTIDDGESIGDVKRIATQFSFCAPQEFLDGNIRVSSSLEPQGCLGDLGWYNIRFTLWAMNYAMPKSVTGRLISSVKSDISDEPTPTEFSGEMFFDGGVSASFYCSFLTEHQQWANISGTKGYLQVPDFVLPFFGAEIGYEVSNNFFDLQGCFFVMEEHKRREVVREYANNHPTSQEANLFRNFADLVLGGEPDPKWGKIALQTQQVMDACAESAGNGSQPVTL